MKDSEVDALAKTMARREMKKAERLMKDFGELTGPSMVLKADKAKK
jgi:hypothetical protein